MVSEARTIPAQRESEGESNHSEKVSFAMLQGVLPRHLCFVTANSFGDKTRREFPESVWQGAHSRDPSTCAYPGSAGTRAALRKTVGKCISSKLTHYRIIEMLYSTPASRFYRPGTASSSRCASIHECSSGPAAPILPAQVTCAPALPCPTVCLLLPAGPQLHPASAGAPGTACPDQHPGQAPAIPFAKSPGHAEFDGTAGRCGSHRAKPATRCQFLLPDKGRAAEQLPVLCVCLLPLLPHTMLSHLTLPHNANRSTLNAAAGTATLYRCPASFRNCSYLAMMAVILCRQSSGP